MAKNQSLGEDQRRKVGLFVKKRSDWKKLRISLSKMVKDFEKGQDELFKMYEAEKDALKEQIDTIKQNREHALTPFQESLMEYLMPRFERSETLIFRMNTIANGLKESGLQVPDSKDLSTDFILKNEAFIRIFCSVKHLAELGFYVRPLSQEVHQETEIVS